MQHQISIQQALIAKQDTLSVFIDLTKAFDSIRHDLLISKLYKYGIRGKPLQLLQSYLEERIITVQLENNVSRKYTVCPYGVPQGSVIGPLLFLLYINELPNIFKDCQAILFADDTTISASHPDKEHLFRAMNANLNQLSQWCKQNSLVINPKKSNYMLFSQNNEHNTNDQTLPSLSLSGKTVSKCSQFKFLGITLDHDLKWREHTANVNLKVGQGLFALKSMKHIVSRSTLIKAYHAFVQTHIDYGCLLWGNTYERYLKPIKVNQKKAIRIITNSPYNEHSTPLFRDLNLLRLHEIYKLQCGQFSYKLHQETLPPITQNIFYKYKHNNPRPLRNTPTYKPPVTTKEIIRKGILYNSITSWQHIPANTRDQDIPKLFKTSYITHLVASIT